MFPFDDLLYEEGKSCRTLNIDIPARSKWDAVTNRRVCKFDHYCAVVNQSIGLRNLRWFLLFNRERARCARATEVSSVGTG